MSPVLVMIDIHSTPHPGTNSFENIFSMISPSIPFGSLLVNLAVIGKSTKLPWREDGIKGQHRTRRCTTVRNSDDQAIPLRWAYTNLHLSATAASTASGASAHQEHKCIRIIIGSVASAHQQHQQHHHISSVSTSAASAH